MTVKKFRFQRRLGTTLGAAMLTLGTASVQAQTEQTVDSSVEGESILETVVVTGSRIPRRGFESLQAATVLDSEQIELRNTFNVSDLLNEQSGFVAVGNTPAGGQASDTLGQSFADYLGLGPQRTLTLVNGQRFPSGASPSTDNAGLAVDLNAIPELLIDRVETIAIGGAPIYGADAIAGTVNIILKDDYEGANFTASIGGSTEYDFDAEYRLGGTWGKNFADGRGNIALAASVSSRPGLRYTDRDQTFNQGRFLSPADPDAPFDKKYFENTVVAVDNVRPFPLFEGFRGGRGFGIFGNGIPVSAAPGAPIAQFDAAGNLVPFVPGGGTGDLVFQNGGDGLRVFDFTSLYTDLERTNLNLFVNYDLTADVKFKGEIWFARTDATEVVNQPFYNSPAFGGRPTNNFGNVGEGPIPVLIDNPFLPAATRSTILSILNQRQDANGDGRADPTIDTNNDGVPDAVGFWRGGPNINVVNDNFNSSQRDTIRVVLGFEGEFGLANKPFRWDAGLTYGRTTSDDQRLEIDQPNFEQAIQVVADANGNPVCADQSNGCVPLNVIGAADPAAVEFVSDLITDKVEVDQTVLYANIGGELFDLPAGPVGFAAGFAYRDESSMTDPNDLQEFGRARSLIRPVSGDFDSKEIFTEIKVPLLGGGMDIPFVEHLDFEGAARYVDNSISGDDVTWTAGLRFAPVEDVEFRGNYTEAIRAPSVRELFTVSSQTFAFAQDPCDTRFINQGNFPERRAANCAAIGISQPFISLINDASVQGTTSGNLTLENEIAESTSFGFVARPRFIEGLTFSVDWFDIDLANAIQNLSIQDLLIACFDSDDPGAEPACNRFERDPAGQVIDFTAGFVNVALLEYKGVQSSLDYATGLGDYGDLRISMNYLKTATFDRTPGSGNREELAGRIGYSKDRITASVTWGKDRWTVFNQLRFIDGAVFDNADGPETRDLSGVESFFVVDTGVSYQVNENLSVQLNIDNLFNEEAPFAAIAGTGSITTYIDGYLERYASFTVRGTY